MNHQVKLGSAVFVGELQASKHDSARVYVSIDGKVIGHYVVNNFYRDNWKEMLQAVQKYTDVHVLSGDNDAEQGVLQEVVKKKSNIQFYQSPTDKLRYISQLKEEGKHVMMVGDGLNDVGALKEAQVGIAVADDVYQFSPASDAIISAAELKQLPAFIKFSKAALKIVYVAIFISFLYNVVGLSFAVTGHLSPLFAAVLMPLSSVSVVVFTSLSVMLAAKKRKM